MNDIRVWLSKHKGKVRPFCFGLEEADLKYNLTLLAFLLIDYPFHKAGWK
jgi:hypothetical protein